MLSVTPDRAQIVAHKPYQGNGCLECLRKEDALCPDIEVHLHPPISHKALSVLGPWKHTKSFQDHWRWA